LVEKNLIARIEEQWGSKTIIKYRVSQKGRAILSEILEPYEALFPRREMSKVPAVFLVKKESYWPVDSSNSSNNKRSQDENLFLIIDGIISQLNKTKKILF
jgi:hypothetical protein